MSDPDLPLPPGDEDPPPGTPEPRRRGLGRGLASLAGQRPPKGDLLALIEAGRTRQHDAALPPRVPDQLATITGSLPVVMARDTTDVDRPITVEGLGEHREPVAERLSVAAARLWNRPWTPERDEPEPTSAEDSFTALTDVSVPPVNAPEPPPPAVDDDADDDWGDDLSRFTTGPTTGPTTGTDDDW